VSVRELSWGEAFEYAMRFVIYAIPWIIVGGLLLWWGVSLIASAKTSDFYPDVVALTTQGVFVLIVGLTVFMLGVMATFFKLMSRLISEAIPRSQSPS